jgi:hypothetical protein
VGSEEDSAQSVFRLVPRPLLADSARWLAQDGLVMRFGARLLLPPDYPQHMGGDAQRRCAAGRCAGRSAGQLLLLLLLASSRPPPPASGWW